MDKKYNLNLVSKHIFFIKLFYVFNLAFIISLFNGVFRDWINTRPQRLVDILFWFHWVPFPQGEVILIVLTLFFNIMALIRFENQFLRIMTFIFSLFFYGRCFSPDNINHNYYFILYPLFFTTLFSTPSKRNLPITSRFCLTAVFLPFTLAGFNKIYFAIQALFTGHSGAFNDIWAFHKLIALEIPLLEDHFQLKNQWILDHPLLTYTIYLLGIGFEFISAFIVWFERYLVLIGIGFIFFQLGTIFFIDIFFQQATLIFISAAFLYPNRK